MPMCPFTEVHPLLGVKGMANQEKQAGRPKGSKVKKEILHLNRNSTRGQRFTSGRISEG